MKLSQHQLEVLHLLKDGWELGCDVYQIGHVGLVEKCRLQKHGLGHGDPIRSAKIVTINALVRKGLIKRLENNFVMTQPTRYELTEKGVRALK